MEMPPEPQMPLGLECLTGIAKERIRALRARYQIGLLHSDDEPARPAVLLVVQMAALQVKATTALGTSKRTRE